MTSRLRMFAGAVLLLGALGGCDGGGGSAGGDPTASASAAASASASVSPSAKPTPPKPTPPKPTPPKPTPPKPTPPKPTAKPIAGTPMTTANAYMQVSEDENLTDPDPENGCEVHDPDLNVTSCNVFKMAGGTATYVVGTEKTNLPGQDEPRIVVRLYRRNASGTDEMTHVAFGEPGAWAGVRVRYVSLTGQTADTLVVEVSFRGSGTLKGYDLLTWRKGTPRPALVAHHNEGPKGVVRVEGGAVHFYEADYSDGAPNCCPTKFAHDRAKWDPSIGKFRLAKLGTVKQPPY